MANRQEDIAALLVRSKVDFAQIKDKYNRSLREMEIPADLKVDIKNLCASLRSILDYLAHDIREIYCSTARSRERFYFPILADRPSFESKMDRWFPSLGASCPALWSYLESIQPYHEGCRWLGSFNRLNNENKHDCLVEQTRSEHREVSVTTTRGIEVSWKPESVRFGPGVYIDGVPVDPETQLPVSDPSQRVARITWIDFRFEGIDVSALALLRSALEGIEHIASRIAEWL